MTSKEVLTAFKRWQEEIEDALTSANQCERNRFLLSAPILIESMDVSIGATIDEARICFMNASDIVGKFVNALEEALEEGEEI